MKEETFTTKSGRVLDAAALDALAAEAEAGYDPDRLTPRPWPGRPQLGVATIRAGKGSDVEGAVRVWATAHAALRAGEAPSEAQVGRVRTSVLDLNSFLYVAEDNGEIVGMALAMQGRGDDGAGPVNDLGDERVHLRLDRLDLPGAGRRGSLG